MSTKGLILEVGLVLVTGFASSSAVTAVWNLWRTGLLIPNWEISSALAVGLAVAIPLSRRLQRQGDSQKPG